MNLKHQKVWKSTLPYLKKGKMKDFIVHTEGVMKAITLILKHEKADKNILILAAILHDVGWAKVPKELQEQPLRVNKLKLKKAMKLHLEYSQPIIEKILGELNYKQKDIERIVGIVKDHKYKNPKDKEKRLLIDADNLSDVFKKQFWTDVKKYKADPKEQYEFRRLNKFYTKTARDVFEKELNKRKKELKLKQ